MLRKKVIKKITSKLKLNTLDDYSKLSFSQCGEDLIIKFIFDCLKIKKPSYIDIGAHHPFYLSNTALLYRNGSRGINVEPDPSLFRSFLENRLEDSNVNVGVGNSKEELDFYIISSPTLNTFSKEEAEKYSKEGDYTIKEVKKIEVLPVSEILTEFSNGAFPQFLNVDAEGIDEMIIKQIDFSNNYPIVICLETISFSTNGSGVKDKSLIDYIESNGYLVYADTYINTIFVKKEYWENKK